MSIALCPMILNKQLGITENPKDTAPLCTGKKTAFCYLFSTKFR